MIPTGTEWEPQIKAALHKADIVVSLVSVHSLASDYFMKHEMAKVFKRRKAGECEIIPVILDSCLWKRTPFKNIQALPKDGKPVNTFAQKDEAFKEVAQVVEEKAEAIRNPEATLRKKLDEAIRLFNTRDYKESIRLLREIQMSPMYASMPIDFTHKVGDTLLLCEKALKDEPDSYKNAKVIGSYVAIGIFWILIGVWIGPLFIENKGRDVKKDKLGVSEDKTSVIPVEELDTIPLASLSERMVLVEGGTFMMSCTSGQQDCDDEKLVHKVKVSSFYMGTTEVSFEEYDAYCDATGKEKPNDMGWGGGKRPVINVNWYDAIKYCNWLSESEDLDACYTLNGNTVYCAFDKNGYRLPTEAEWEYAAREGGKSILFGNGKDVADLSELNFDGRDLYTKMYSSTGVYRGETVGVGSFSPNSLGLYDMSGNVWEWCWDQFGAYGSEFLANPRGATSGSYRVIRGGSWYDLPVRLRVALRYYYDPINSSNAVGFRLVRTGIDL